MSKSYKKLLISILVIYELMEIKIGVVISQTTNASIVNSRSVCNEQDFYDSETDTCLTKVNAISSKCPKNCQKFGHLCKCIDELSMQSICPSDYYLSENNKKCIKEEKVAPLIECGRGLKWSENKNVCVGVKLLTPESKCSKENSMLINGICLTYNKKKIQDICEEGYIKKEKVEHNLYNNMKLSTRVVKSSFQNYKNDELKQSGSNNNGVGKTTYCIKEVKSQYNLECSKGFIMDKESSTCIAQIFSDPKPICLSGFEFDLKSETCINKTEGEPVKRVCPKDYVLEGFQCIQSSFSNPEPRCREGFVFSIEEGTCIKILREPPSYRCPSDSYIFDGKQCELIRVEKSTMSCGNDTILDEKMQKCYKHNVLPAKMICPSGKQYDEIKKKCYEIQVRESIKVCSSGETYIKEKDACVKYEEKKAEKGCPYGFTLNESDQICIQENLEEPKLYCKEPYSLIGGDCMYNAELKPEYVCPDNFEYNENRMECIFESTLLPEYGCPDEYNEYIDKCIKQIEKNPISVCPENSKLNSNSNECFVMKKPYKECPNGFIPTDESIKKCIQVINTDNMQKQVNSIAFNNQITSQSEYKNRYNLEGTNQKRNNNVNNNNGGSNYKNNEDLDYNSGYFNNFNIINGNRKSHNTHNIKTAPRPRNNSNE
ncbi:oocyst wall protein 5 [Cryptosporidium ryanae]|uniref:oocyst wall protein 5 n=1 Tax=Cryptosporidium ryanae TaxID=515981 RepID=UPI00351A4F9C|nr:oocyst wall protein 5 [Cryptosporidium ryanae]